MATRTRNGNANINAAIAVLLQTQAQFVAELAETRKEFAAIRQDPDTIKAVLVRHENMLEKLTDAIRRRSASKIRFYRGRSKWLTSQRPRRPDARFHWGPHRVILRSPAGTLLIRDTQHDTGRDSAKYRLHHRQPGETYGRGGNSQSAVSADG